METIALLLEHDNFFQGLLPYTKKIMPVIVGVSVAIAAIDLQGESANKDSSSNSDETFSEHLRKIDIPNDYKLSEYVVGEKSAPVELVVYFSYTCPHCREFFLKDYPKFKKEYIDTGKVRIIFRNYIDDQGSLEATQIVRCFAGESISEYLKLSKAVLSKQKEWLVSQDPPKFLKDIFAKEKYSEQKTEACLKRSDIGAGLMLEQKRAMHSLHILSIPAFIVQGKKMHTGGITYKQLEELCAN
jgi:protein-disulfide isomerase